MKPCKKSNQGYDNGSGYRKFNRRVDGEKYLHRIIYKSEVGPLASDEIIRHICDNPWCVESTHLIKGSQQDNINDMIVRNRQANGEKNGNSKLTDDEIIEIFDLHKMGWTQSQIAEEFNIDQSNVSYILNKKTWKHI